MSKDSKKKEYVLATIFILLWSSILIGVYFYASTLTTVGSPHFLNVEIKGVHVINLTRVVVEVQAEGNVDANVTGIFVEGVSVRSEPATPFILKVGSLPQSFTLILATPLKMTIGFPLEVRLTRGYVVSMQWYEAEATVLGYGTPEGPSFQVSIKGPTEDMVVMVTDDEGRNFGNMSVPRENFRYGSATVSLKVPSNMMLLNGLYYFTFFDVNGNQLYQTSCTYEMHV